MEREAFARAWRFLNYRPAAKWAAVAAAVATGVLYLFLLFVLGLFADLMVSHGRIPSFRSLSPTAREAFIRDWAALSDEERQQLLEKIGSDPKTAGEVTKVSDPADLPASEQEFVWRARVFEILEERVNATAAALTLPAFSELSPRLQRGFFRRWQELLPRERDERLRLIQEERPGLALPADPAKLPADQQELLWRAHLVMQLREEHPEAARAFREDRQDRGTLQEGETPGAPEFLADSGILSLIVRSSNHPIDRYYAPVLGIVARIWTGTWRWGDVPYLTRLLVFAAILALLRASRCSHRAISRLERPSRPPTGCAAVYHHTFRLGTLAFRSLGFSEAVGIFTRQLEAVHEGLYVRLTVVYREPVKFALLLAFALVLNVWLSLAFLLFALLVWLIGGQVAAYFRRQERAATRRAGSSSLCSRKASL